MKVQIVRNEEIDRIKWDECILNAQPSLVNANSWYLDVVCPGWQALVIDDYSGVFPLPVKKKLGLTYCHQPLFTQQLGLFAGKPEKIDLSEVLGRIPRSILSVRLFLNHENKVDGNNGFSTRLNHILPLKDLESVKSGYNQNTRRNLKSAASNELEIRADIDIDTFVNFKKETSAAVLSDDAWSMMNRLITTLIDHNCGEFILAYHQGVLVSALFLSNFDGRITYLFSASSAKGKEERASFLLVDEIIKSHVDSCEILDFEGSMDENISRFFKGFGAVQEVYYEYRRGFNI